MQQYAHVLVTAKDIATGQKLTATSDENGKYTIIGIRTEQSFDMVDKHNNYVEGAWLGQEY